MLGQDRKLAEDERQLAVCRLWIKIEAHGSLRHLFDTRHIGIVLAVKRVALGFKRLQAPDDVGDRDGLAVMPAGALAQGKRNPGAIFRHGDALRQQAIFGKGLVGGTGK